jgi:hypothetical protein
MLLFDAAAPSALGERSFRIAAYVTGRLRRKSSTGFLERLQTVVFRAFAQDILGSSSIQAAIGTVVLKNTHS